MGLLTDYFPSNLSEETTTYVRASFGAVAAYAFAVNPLAGGLVLLGHATWEFADLYMRPVISEQALRFKAYTSAFETLKAKAIELGSKCSEGEFEKARNIFFVHNLIEEACYKALPEIISDLKITGDVITEAQSDFIMARLKKAAHVELRKDGGYTKKGREMITEEQFAKVLANIATIIHDRDGRLTHARYPSLTDLCIALDDHNDYVKNTLFNSWFKCDGLECKTHLDMIKGLVGFNEKLTAQLGFDFNAELVRKKDYYDTHHKDIRKARCPVTKKETAESFVNLTEVRARFSSADVHKLLESDGSTTLTEALKRLEIITPKEIAAMTSPRSHKCAAQFHKPIARRPLLDSKITVSAFLDTYFPETSQHPSEAAAGAPRRALTL